MTVTPSAYFTSGQTSWHETNTSASLYLTLSQNQKYLFTAYDYYRETGYDQHLFGLGFSQPIANKLWLRGVGFTYLTSTDNLGIIGATRISYGYTPVYSLGFCYSAYSHSLAGIRKFSSVYQFNPEYQRPIYQTNITLGVVYTNAYHKSYFAGAIKANKNLTAKLNLEIAGAYGKLFHHIDDRLLVVNNRPDVQRTKIALRLKYRLPVKNLSVAGIVTRNIFDNYYINYYTAGLEYTWL